MEIRVKNDFQLSFVKIGPIFFRLTEWIDIWINSSLSTLCLKLLTLKMYEVQQIISAGAKTDV
jgi:hypothetical protein